MPGVMVYPTLAEKDAKEWRRVEELYRNELKERTKRIEQNQAYYDGNFPDTLKSDSGVVNDNIKINLVGMIVDKDNAAMLGIDDSGEIEGVRILAENNEDVQSHLDEFWEANEKNLLLLKTFRNNSLAGHTFIKLIPKDAEYKGKEYTRLVCLNPANVSVFWKEDDPYRVLWYRIAYGNFRQDIVRNMSELGDFLPSWKLLDYNRQHDRAKWVLTKEETWAYPFPPLVEWSNLVNTRWYYGYDDLGTLPAINIAYNFGLSAQQKIIRNRAGSVVMITGGSLPVDESGAVQMTSDRIIDGLDKEAQPHVVEMGSDVLKPSSEHAAIIRKAFFNSSRELDPQSIEGRIGDLSNFDLRVLYNDTLAKRQTKWLTAAPGLKRLCEYELALANLDSTVDIKVMPPDPLPKNEIEETQALAQDVQVFELPPDMALEKRDYDLEEVQKRRKEKQRQDAMNQRRTAQAQQTDETRAIGRARRQPQSPENMPMNGKEAVPVG